MFYILMHENRTLAIIEADNYSISNIRVNETEQKYLPVGCIDIGALKKWILNRGIPVTRQGINTELAKVKKESTFEFMLSNLGLSLTDHYWIKKLTDKCTWEAVNLYTNDFKSAYSLDLSNDISSIADKTNFIPSASLKGDLRKKWIINKSGDRVLIKGNYNSTCRQSICEALASKIHEKQSKFIHTHYGLVEIESDGNKIIGCTCKNFTSIDTEFVSAIEIANSFKKCNSVSYYEEYIRYCEENGIDKDYIRRFMEYQIMTDFIITNTDRHFNNFGVIRNVKTLKLICPAPIFDSGNSMFYNSQYIPIDRGLLNIDVSSFVGKEVKLLKYVTNRNLVDLSKLPSVDEVSKLLDIDSVIKKETNDRIIRAYIKKIEYLKDFQNGANIWEYRYKR